MCYEYWRGCATNENTCTVATSCTLASCNQVQPSCMLLCFLPVNTPMHVIICPQTQIESFNSYMTDFNATMTSKATFDAAGNGAFVHSCFTHQGAFKDELFSTVAINAVTLKDAVTNWWQGIATDPAVEHIFLPCTYNATNPSQCNPTYDTDSSVWVFVASLVACLVVVAAAAVVCVKCRTSPNAKHKGARRFQQLPKSVDSTDVTA